MTLLYSLYQVGGQMLQRAASAEHPLPVMASAAERDSAGGRFEPSACTYTYGYNANGLIVTDTATDGTSTWVKTYTYNASAQLTGETQWVKQ